MKVLCLLEGLLLLLLLCFNLCVCFWYFLIGWGDSFIGNCLPCKGENLSSITRDSRKTHLRCFE